MLSSTTRHGSRRGSWKTMPIAPGGRTTAPSKSASSPATMRSIVVLPQPDGPTNAPISPWLRVNAMSRSTSAGAPAADTNDFRTMRTSSRAESPTGRTSFKGLHQKRFDRQHDCGEAQGIGENTCHIEELERNTDLESDAVGPSQELDDEDDLPHQRQAGARRRRDVRTELRQDHVAEGAGARHGEHARHLVETGIERARAFAHR